MHSRIYWDALIMKMPKNIKHFGNQTQHNMNAKRKKNNVQISKHIIQTSLLLVVGRGPNYTLG
jgi:hypothetical protein